MQNFIVGIFSILFVALISNAYGQQFLIIPSVRSLHELKSAEKFYQLLKSSNRDATILIHQTDLQFYKDRIKSFRTYGNSDELLAVLRNDSSIQNQNNAALAQLEGELLLRDLSLDRFSAVICNAEDPICNFINQQKNFNIKINLFYTCPKEWSNILQNLPEKNKSSFSKFISKVKGVFSSLFTTKSKNFFIKYHINTLYLSQCFEPYFNPQPSLENIFTVGSFIGSTPAQQLPDAYKKPTLLANKVVLVYLGPDENSSSSVLLETMKSFPDYLFIILSRDFSLKRYALGNVIIDENAPLDEILTSHKIAMLISNGEWTILLNALYHGVPSLTIGNSKEGAIGREFIKEMKCGIDLSQERLERTMLQDNIREIVFDKSYQATAKHISSYVKGMNAHYMIPRTIEHFFSAKKKTDADL